MPTVAFMKILMYAIGSNHDNFDECYESICLNPKQKQGYVVSIRYIFFNLVMLSKYLFDFNDFFSSMHANRPGELEKRG